jgi:uroporphyrinogen III methyltransferase/synthase
MKKGKVYLVGAGPGDAGLITVRGSELLRDADCIVYDRLVNPSLLKYVKKSAEIIEAGKRAGSHSYRQHEINELLIERAMQGKTVVRLKGGDPVIFARGAEEATSLADAGVEFEFVPGITAAVGAAEYAGIMLTHRDYSSAVALITGHEADDKQKSNVDWAALARFEGTLIFYMGVANLESITEELMKNRMSKDTPAAVIANATLPSQRIVTAKLVNIAQTCIDENIEPPAILIIGHAARPDERLNWFMRKPLFGQSIVVTRDAEGNTELAEKIIRQGGFAIEFAAIELKRLTDTSNFQKALKHIGSYDWVVFTSSNGVEMFFEMVGKSGKDARIFKKARVAAIGSITAARLKDFGIVANFVPDIFTGTELGRQLAKIEDLANRKILLLRSAIASKELADKLKGSGAVVDDIAIYTTEPSKGDATQIIEAIRQGRINWLTFTSSSTVRAFFEQIEPKLVKSTGLRIASIGPVTTEQLKKFSLKVSAEAKFHTIDGLVNAMCKYKK